MANTRAVGTDAVLKVELTGLLEGGTAIGLNLQAGAQGSVIRGLVINRFRAAGIEMQTSSNVIAGNFIGTDVSGTQDLGNRAGVLFNTCCLANSNLIGGTSPADRNLISGNLFQGVGIGDGHVANQVLGNLIGTDRSGLSPLGNGGDGVEAFGVENVIGDTDAGSGNTVAFNGGAGVDITAGNRVSGTRSSRTSSRGSQASAILRSSPRPSLPTARQRSRAR